MKRTRHIPEQVINKLREADAMLAAGKTVGQVLQTENSLSPVEDANTGLLNLQNVRDAWNTALGL